MLLLIWVIYFVTDVYGHVALKVASQAPNWWTALFSFWGISAGLSWAVSVITWATVLSRQPLLTANTVSALTYVLIAAAAALVFREPLTRQNMMGMLCVLVGIYLVTH